MAVRKGQDNTVEFKKLVTEAQGKLPPQKKKATKPSTSTSAGAAGGHPPASAAKPEENWTKQAENVAVNLRSFATFLHSIRRAYLDLSSSSSSAHHSSQPRQLDHSKGLAAWEGVKWLNDRERDEIDFGVKIALQRSVERVRELEAAEKVRLAKEAVQNPNTKLSRMLGLPLPSSTSASATSLASHRSEITLYLNTLLARVSQIQKDQQELRVERQLEKTASLGGMGGDKGGKVNGFGGVNGTSSSGSGGGSGKGKGKQDDHQHGEVPSIYRPSPRGSFAPSTADYPLQENEEADELDALLTAEQIQQFEAEESQLLKSTQADLASIQHAQTSLLEIGALQGQLAMHLSQQSEMTDRLWEESVAVTGKVEEGNVQLKKARERNRESRVWLLVFLMMASGTLVFLDYYS